MPRLWAFSNDALRLEKHYSGGNLTQMGVFSMFYGLYGSNWFPMRAAQRAPVLMDVLQQQNYQFALHTSQRFTPVAVAQARPQVDLPGLAPAGAAVAAVVQGLACGCGQFRRGGGGYLLARVDRVQVRVVAVGVV